MSHFLTKQVRIFYPYLDESPTLLLEQAGVPRERLDELHQEPFVRVAKAGDQIVGAYLMTRLETERFAIDAVVVDAGTRGRGLGGWLIGHAIGVAESKGGRQVICRCAYPGTLFERLGFTGGDTGWQLTITPE